MPHPADDKTALLRVVPAAGTADSPTAFIDRVPALPPEDEPTASLPPAAEPTAFLPVVRPAAASRPGPGSAETAVIDRIVADPLGEETTFLSRIPRDRPIRSHRPLFDREHWVRSSVRTLGESMITCGLILLLFAAYEVWGKDLLVGENQRDLDSQLAQDWGGGTDPTVSTGPGGAAQPLPLPGNALGRIYIPRMGKHWTFVEGVAPKDIRLSPGHYPGTALPGQIGNFSLAGHRIPAIFWDLDQIKAGDKIVVETRDTYFVYNVTAHEIVKPTAVQVVAPVPDHSGQKATKAMLTLTTCNPKWDNYQRYIVHAQLERQQPHSAGLPVEANGA